MPILLQKFYTKDNLRAHPDWLYIFGDNHYRKGIGGQALACRDEPNAVGIVTKNRPDYNEGAFLSDTDFFKNIEQIIQDWIPALEHLSKGGTVVYPLDGIGTGRANLKYYAPLTLKFLDIMYEYMLEFTNDIKVHEENNFEETTENLENFTK